MLRQPYSYDPRGDRSPQSRWALGALAVVCIGISLRQLYYSDLNGGQWPRNGVEWAFVIAGVAQLLFFVAMLITPRTLFPSQFLRIDAEGITFRGFGPLQSRRRTNELAWAQVQRVEVGVGEVCLHLVDGDCERLNLGSLPYQIIQEIKAQFGGGYGHARSPSWQLIRQALEHTN